ncbi:beta strand repeat-containing protein [Methanobrevibacter cuticularis]|nr:right-handed parallel beta-helix repeat-containing protein [Methanobrevibacter cuticularis]
MFIKNKRFMSFSLIVLAILVCFTVSGVSAGSHEFISSNTTAEFQSIIDIDNDADLEINLTSASYNNILGPINVTRSNVTIQGKGNPVITGSGSGILFNITAPNVRIINLTIVDYTSAIASNSSDLTISGNNITTSGVSINLTSSGGDLNNITIEDNVIVSSIANTNYGAVYVYAPTNSRAVIDVSLINNNITGNGASNSNGVRFNTVGCSLDLIFENNNITGTSNYGVYLYASSSNNTNITFTNNNITGTSNYGVYLYTPSSINSQFTLTNNNITGTSGSGVYLDASSSNNVNITFTNNNVTGTYEGVYLYTPSSINSQFTLTNNNITGTSNYGVYLSPSNNNSQFTFTNNNITGTYGVYLYASSSNNVNITFTNNNITGTYGVYLVSLTSINSQFTFTNNNITGTSSYGVYLSTIDGNNVEFTFTNNNIKGTPRGVDLTVVRGNNVEFTFTNNNITGTYGVYLYAYSNNNNITFNENNITGGSYAVYVYPTGNFFSGIRFLNNTINATSGDGFGFSTGSVIGVSDFIVRGNTIYAENGAGLNFTGLFAGSLVNVTVEYNRIISLVGVNITSYNDNSSFDYNWWGVDDIANKIFGIDTNNHYILNITNSSSLDDVHFGDIVSFYLLVLNTTRDNTDVGNLPDFVINGTLNGVPYNVSRADGFVYEFTVPKGGTNILDASLDAAYNITTFGATQANTNSTIVVNPDSVKIGENVTVSGVLANHTGINGINVTVDGTLFENVTVNPDGSWSLNYTTNVTGILDIVVSFAGNENYTAFSNSTTFNVTKLAVNSTINIPSNVKVGKTITIDGILVDENGNPVANALINVTIDGVLFENVTVNPDGSWSLNYTTNVTGILDIVVSFAGNENYTAFSNSTTFNVTKLGVNSTINVPGTINVGKTITIDGVLVDENGNVVANAVVSVSVGGKVYSLKTDNSGRWSLTYKPTHVGSVNAVLNYAGSDKYFSYTNTTTFNVVKGKAIVDATVVKNSDGSVDVIVTVTDEDGDPIPNYKVNVELDGKHIGDIVTDVFGVGRIHIPSSKLSDGHHVITVLSDDENYNANPVSAEFEIQNNKNDTNNPNKTSNNPVATATMKNTGMPIIAIILVLLTTIGISIRKKQD